MQISRYILSLGGIGFVPKAPGTFGSLASLILLFGLLNLDIPAWRFVYLLVFFGVFLGHLFLIKKFVQKPYDKSWIVLDEFLGMQLALLPFLFFELAPIWAVLGFVLFRLFDIWKPGIIGTVDKNGTPESVIYDDVLAGALSALVMTILIIGGQAF